MDVSQLIKEAKHKSAAAQKCLFDLFADKLMLVCMRYVKVYEDAEEILMDGFYKFFKSIDAFNYCSDAELYAWLKRIMVNECLMMLRKKNAFTIVTESTAEATPFREEALNNLSAKEIFDLIIQLPVGYRTVFNLHVIEGIEHKEIAAMMNISEGTSKSQLSKAKALLQKIYCKTEVNMAEEKFNKDWKEKLDDVSNLSHAVLQNKEVAWEKLYARLDEKPHQKRVVWYWLAAACLFFVIAISVFSVHHSAITSKNNNTESSDAKRSIAKNNEPIKQVTAQPLIVHTQHTSIKDSIVKNDVKKPVINDTSLAATSMIINKNNDSQSQITTAFITADSSVKTIIASTSIQKKLKVVHVNELGEPVEFNTDVVHTTDLHLFQLKLAQQEIYNASAIAANNNSVLSFKRKSSSN